MARAAIIILLGGIVLVAQQPAGTRPSLGECVMLQALDEPQPWVSDQEECARPTAPASTFKIPHALIALETGVVVDPRQEESWDHTAQPFRSWERSHSLESAIRWSVVWFFQRTAAAIGPDRMQRHLRTLGYASDQFDGDVTRFWLNGDLVVTPVEQMTFLRRLLRGDLPASRSHLDAVLGALMMPAGQITNASGSHPFALGWPAAPLVRAKTGNTRVGHERVSWVVGSLESEGRQHVFVSRVRGESALPGTAAIDLTIRVLGGKGRTVASPGPRVP